MVWIINAKCDYKECKRGANSHPLEVEVAEVGAHPDDWFEVRSTIFLSEAVFCSPSCLAEWANELPARPRRPRDQG